MRAADRQRPHWHGPDTPTMLLALPLMHFVGSVGSCCT